MKRLILVSLFTLSSVSAFALDCKMYEGKIGKDLSGREYRYTEELPLEKEITSAGHALNFENEHVSGSLRITNIGANLFTNFDGLELVANGDVKRGKLDYLKQSIKTEILGEKIDFSVVCDDLKVK